MGALRNKSNLASSAAPNPMYSADTYICIECIVEYRAGQFSSVFEL